MILGACRRFEIDDVRVDIGDFGAQLRNHPLPILDLHRQTHRVRSDVRSLVPFDVDAAARIVLKVDDVRTVRGVNRDALPTGDVPDDFLPPYWITAPGAEHHQVVDASYNDSVRRR